jgi:hypothetical protein
MERIELMGIAGDEKLVFEEDENGMLMVEMIAPFSNTKVCLDEAGRSRMMEFLSVDRECCTCRHLMSVSGQDPCYSCNFEYDHWEREIGKS